jgi:hypothetical protein
MGKVNFESHKVGIEVPAEKVYLFLSDLNNLQHLMPEQVINWKSTESSCSFDIKGMAHITLERDGLIENRQVKIISTGDNPLELEIRGNIDKMSANQASAWIELTADLSPMLKLMVSGPMQNLVNIMADRLKAAF